MKEFSITALAQTIKAEPTKNAGVFTGVSIDSRTTQPGDCFFAIAGDNLDGHDYIPDAFTKGAACAVISKNFKKDKFTHKTILKVNNTIKALGRFALEYRRQTGFKVIAITGSVGKTTTRQITYHVLSRHFRVFAAPKNFNNNIGLPLTLLGANPEDQIIITELGSNHPGEIAYLTRISRPDIAVVTNAYPAHLAGFGDLQAIIQEKLSISEGLQAGGTLIINADCDQLVDACLAKGIAFYTFGKSDRCDVQAQNIAYNTTGSRFTIDGTQVLLPLPGPGNVENAITAWSICRQFGITIDNFARTVKNLPAVPMRAELLQIGTLTVLNDCYNANPTSTKNPLDILAGLPFYNKPQNWVPVNLGSAENRRLVFICGDMAEL